MERLLHGMVGRHGALPGSAQDGQLAYREASTLAFADAFRAIMLAFIVATLLVPLLRNIAAPSAPSSDAH
jgi:DHA2 family multidrug resistance protein